ncbi:MAG: RAMP superfamily CRISPR-associated protein [Thalassobaculum sp.]|uniref:RAMP superfamily CRISPR-associated protein n=1 Tax=Thalassobaculum sp. TaxID=2022740 RepID=UPI0032ED0D1A
MTGSATIVIDLESYWHVGTGRGSSGLIDSLCARDRDGLPYLPGRSLKGLLRDAVDRAEAWGWFADLGHPPTATGTDGALTRRLFGQIGFEREGDSRSGTPIRVTERGCLAFTSARLAALERAALTGQSALKEHLFATLATTAVDPTTGTAKEQSLRTDEVAVPVTLEATVSALEDSVPPDWRAILALAMPLVRAVGGSRSRGLGQCRLSLVGEGSP